MKALKGLWCIFFIILFFDSGLAQFYTQPTESQYEDYENYGVDGYENYSKVFLTNKWYDDFGNYLTEGLPVYNLTHFPNSATGSGIVKHRYYWSFFQNLIVSRDTYKGFSTSFIVGDQIRSKFTPFTMNRANFNGIRWDGYTDNNQFSLIISRPSDPLYIPPVFSGTNATALSQSSPRKWATYLLGGHWETQVGDVLKFGATYVNMFQTFTGTESREFSLKGSAGIMPPRFFYIRLEDDSPEDGGGGIMLAEPLVLVNGNTKAQLLNPGVIPLQVNGEAKYEFIYHIPEGVNNISVSCVVSNDYRLSAAHDYQAYIDRSNPSLPDTAYFRTYFEVMKRAKGNVKDQSNKQIVNFDYALNTGRSIYGVNFEANLLGINLKGEYNTNVLNRKFPTEDGKRFDVTSHAWYLQAKRRIGLFEVGGEIFQVDDNYKTWLDIWTPDVRFNNPGTAGSSSPFGSFAYSQFPYATDEVRAPHGPARFNLVDDNDDNDRYADGWYEFVGDSLNSSLQYFNNNDEIYNRANPQPDAGIFPGLDENNDGIPDDNQNSNAIPDYNEAFLMFARDPQRFSYGDDWNNNGIIDSRENDQKEDLLYNRDLRGHHLFFGFKPGRNFSLMAGFIRHWQVAAGGKNFINYLRLLYQIDWPRYGDMIIYYVPKNVQDNIPDDVYVFPEEVDEVDFSIPELQPDVLDYRNSFVQTAYLGGNWKQIKNLRAGFNIKMELNKQRRNYLQNRAQVEYLAWVFPRIEYRIPLSSNFTFIPQYKIRWEQKSRKDFLVGETVTNDLFDRRWEIPILRWDWRMTRNTRLQFGFQGFSFDDLFGIDDNGLFTYRYRDELDETKNENKRIFQLIMTNSTNYSGYNVWLNLGFKHIKTEFPSDLVVTNKKSDYVQFFVQIIAGYE